MRSKPAQESVVRLTDRPDMTVDVYRGRKTTIQQHHQIRLVSRNLMNSFYCLCAKCNVNLSYNQILALLVIVLSNC